MMRTACLALLLAITSLPAAADNWPEFRGPTGQGVSTAARVPTRWSATENVAWKQPIAEETFQHAMRLGDYFIAHAKAAFDVMGADPAVADARFVLQVTEGLSSEAPGQDILAHQTLWQKAKPRFKKVERLDAALAVLVQHNYLREVARAGAPLC